MYKFKPNNSEANPKIKQWKRRTENEWKNVWKQNPDRGERENVSRDRPTTNERTERRTQVVSSLLNFVRICFVMCAHRMSVSGIWISFKFSPGLSAARHAHTNTLVTSDQNEQRRINVQTSASNVDRTNERTNKKMTNHAHVVHHTVLNLKWVTRHSLCVS